MQLPICGPSYESGTKHANYQRCVNMYLTEQGPAGRGVGVLVRTPGLSEATTLGDGPVRGMITVDGYVYTVSGNTIYKLTVDHVGKTVSSATLGTMGTTSGPVYMINNPTQILIVDGSASGYVITLSSGAITTLTIADNFLGATSVAFLDGYFICSEPGTNVLFSSALNDGTTWDALDFAANSQRPGTLVGLGIFRGELWAFSDTCTEVWYDAANSPGFPLSVRQGMGFDVGCSATGSIVELDNLLMWLDTRGYIVESTNSPYIRSNNSGYSVNIVSTDAVNNAIAGYQQVSDAIAYSYTIRGHLMYQITFPNQGVTWVYDRTTKMWHERTFNNTTLGNQEAHLSRCHTQYVTTDLVGDDDGVVYFTGPEYYDDNGTSIRCVRTTQPLNAEFEYIGIDKLEVRMKSGLAPSGTDPQITMRYSNDGANSWSTEESRSIGQTGEYGKRIIWNRLGSAVEWEFEFVISSPTDFAIIDASVDVSGMEAPQNGSNNRQP